MPAAGSQGADGAPARGSIWHRYTPTLVQLCPEQKRRNAAESGDCARGAARREPQRGRERRAGEHSNRSFPRPRSVLFLAGSPPAPPCAVTRSPGRGLRRNLRWGPRARTEGPRATPPGGTCSVPAPPRAGGQRRLAGVRGRWRRGRAAALWGERCMGARRCAGPAAVRLLPALRSAPLHCSPVATPVRSGGSGKGFRRGGGVGLERRAGGGAEKSDDGRAVLRAPPQRWDRSSEAALPAAWRQGGAAAALWVWPGSGAAPRGRLPCAALSPPGRGYNAQRTAGMSVAVWAFFFPLGPARSSRRVSYSEVGGRFSVPKAGEVFGVT